MKHRILVVEDQSSNRELLREWLHAEGYEVLAVGDLQSGVAAVLRLLPHAVLLDLELGSDDGLRLAAWVRKHPQFHSIPIIAVTGHVMLGDQERIFESGCNACISKPVDFRLLRSSLQRWLNTTEQTSAELPAMNGFQG
jgi:two-component system cell cycle response regulator/two-component system cell cycle response regulator DivK